MHELSPRKYSSRLGYYCFVVLTISILLPMPESSLYVQANNWTSPTTIPSYDRDSWPPILIADQYGVVHAFSSQLINTGAESLRAIIYNRWTAEDGWTAPVDILLSPEKEARITDVYLDQNDIIHIAFFGGDNTNANIYYSKAPTSLADTAMAWSLPSVVGENAGDPEGAVFFEGGQGSLYLLYNGRQQGNGLYSVNLLDKSSNSVPIFFAQSDEPNIDHLDVIKSESGWLHAVWGVYNESGQGRGIYYSRSEDGIKWSEPILLADAKEGLGTQTPTIVEYEDTLFIIYNPPGKITMRRSLDDGVTWSDSATMFSRHIGVNGSLSAVADGGGTLHLFFGQRIPGSPDLHGMWHSIWVNNRWSEPEAIVKGPSVDDSVGLKSFDPYEARAVVNHGNTILVTWRTDPGLNGNGVWYSYKFLDIPNLSLQTPVTEILAENEPAPTSTNSNDIFDLSTPEVPIENPTLMVDRTSRSRVWTSGTLMAVGVIPVMLVIIVLVVIKVFRNRSS